jgi:nicotinate phosphoribosyltransferase
LYFRRIRSDEVWLKVNVVYKQSYFIQQYEKSQQPNDPPFLVSDFGTRRRYSFEWQKHVVQAFHAVPNVFRGTSNVLLAKELGISQSGPWHMSFYKRFKL